MTGISLRFSFFKANIPSLSCNGFLFLLLWGNSASGVRAKTHCKSQNPFECHQCENGNVRAASEKELFDRLLALARAGSIFALESKWPVRLSLDFPEDDTRRHWDTYAHAGGKQSEPRDSTPRADGSKKRGTRREKRRKSRQVSFYLGRKDD